MHYIFLYTCLCQNVRISSANLIKLTQVEIFEKGPVSSDASASWQSASTSNIVWVLPKLSCQQLDWGSSALLEQLSSAGAEASQAEWQGHHPCFCWGQFHLT